MPFAWTALLLALGFGLAAAIAAYAWRCATADGAVALGLIVGLVTLVAGWDWGVVPLAYVIALIALSRYRRADKEALSDALRRDGRLTWQGAIARLGWATLLAGMRQMASPLLGYAALVGAVAAAMADLAATQLGLLSAQRPRLLTSWLPARAGTPGAISVLGTLAAVGAAWLLGLIGLLTQAVQSWSQNTPLPRAWIWLPVAALTGGMAGALVDSLLAATAQRVYYDPRRQDITEYEVDEHGAANEPVRGWAWLTNEAIDVVATIIGAAATGVLVFLLAHSIGQW